MTDNRNDFPHSGRILLIRHGETPSNAARVVQTPETPLSERGRRQAERLAHRLAPRRVSRILTSDLARARETAALIYAATGGQLEIDPVLRERDFGEHRGTAYADLGVDIFAPDHIPPAGESWEQFHRRVDRAWAWIRAVVGEIDADADVAVVTHGLVCGSLVGRHLACDTESPRFGNTALTIIEGRSPWRVERLACSAHAGAAGADQG